MKNWRDFVTDDVTLVFDLDSPCYMSASAHETVRIHVHHKETGREVFKHRNREVFENVCMNPEVLEDDYKGNDKPRWVKQGTGVFENVLFDNKTDFWGRTKKVPSGWLGDLNSKREAEGKTPYTFDDFEITEEQVAGELSHAIHSLKMKIQQVKDYLGIDKSIYLIGSGDTHRNLLELPVNPRKENPLAGQYKGNRLDTPRPLLLKDVREYAVNVLNAENIKGVETDDVINMYGWESHKHYKKTGKHKYILVTIDKDQRGFSCMLFNPFKDEKSKDWKHPYPIIIDGLGELDLVNKEIKGYGQKWLLAQMLNGDSSDNYGPTLNMDISFGDVSVYKVLHPCKTLKESMLAVAKQYKEWYPDGVKFKSWSGKDVDITWYEWADTIWECAYMLKSRDDKTTFTGLLEQFGIDYKNLKLSED